MAAVAEVGAAVAAAQVELVRAATAVVRAVATGAERVTVVEWAMAPVVVSVTPTLTTRFRAVVLNLQDKKAQPTMGEAWRPTAAQAT